MPPAGMGDIPGVGAIVAAGGADGAGPVLLTGASVLIGMPGMGAIVDSAATTGAADDTSSSAAARERWETSNDDLGGKFDVLRYVVRSTRYERFIPPSRCGSEDGAPRYIFIFACDPWSLTCALNQAWTADPSEGSFVL
jgi:hypothetical protein